MAFNKKSTATNENTEKTEKRTYEVKVTKVRALKDRDDVVFFNADVNGVSVNDLKFIFYKNKEGNEGSMISYPSEKYEDKDGNTKYCNFAFFPISAELKQDILQQIESLLG